MKKTANDVERSNGYVLEPKYLSAFKCVGSDCKDTCCSGWRVPIDKRTFKKYRRSTSPSLAPLFKEKVIAVKSQDKSDDNFARIVLDKTGDCPFLKESLCRIQIEQGASMLSNTCANYPRISSLSGGIRQVYLTPSCPEAARLVTSDPTALELSLTRIAVDHRSAAGADSDSLGLGADYRNLLHMTVLALLRERAFPAWRRLAAIGGLCYLLDQQIKNKEIESARDMIYLIANSTDELTRFVRDFKFPSAAALGQVEVFGAAWRSKGYFVEGASPLRKEVMSDVAAFFDRFGGKDESDASSLAAAYIDGMTVLEGLYEREGHLLTNYLLNDFGRSRFPIIDLVDNGSLWSCFLRFLSRYGVLRFMLAARASIHGEKFDRENFADTISVFSRIFEHNAEFARAILRCFEAAQCTDYARVLPLITDPVGSGYATSERMIPLGVGPENNSSSPTLSRAITRPESFSTISR